jgi:prephenate dehydrogenase
VAGGGGAVGRMFAKLLADAGAEVRAVDTREQPGQGDTAFREDVTDPGRRLRAELRQAEVVVLAVPGPVALASLESVVAHMRPGSLLVDTLSVKSAFVAAVRHQAPSLEALSLNPMFAPSLGIAGQSVAAVPVRDGPRAGALLRLLECAGARVVVVDAEEHDRLTGVTQALTHAAVISFGLALAQLGLDAIELAELAPPPCLTLLALVARITSGMPEVYWDVQANNGYSEAARDALAGGLRHLAEVVAGGDGSDFAGLMSTAGAALGHDAGRYRDLCVELFTDLKSRQLKGTHP